MRYYTCILEQLNDFTLQGVSKNDHKTFLWYRDTYLRKQNKNSAFVLFMFIKLGYDFLYINKNTNTSSNKCILYFQ